jgi:hypothetical protein
MAVREVRVISDEGKEASVRLGSPPSLLEEYLVGSRSIDTRITSSEDEEKGKGDYGDDKSWNQG